MLITSSPVVLAPAFFRAEAAALVFLVAAVYAMLGVMFSFSLSSLSSLSLSLSRLLSSSSSLAVSLLLVLSEMRR